MSDSVRPQRRQPTRLPRPWDSPGKNTGVGCHFFLQCMKVKSESEVAQSCPTLSDPMDCSLPGSSIHGIFQARELEWGATAFSKITINTLLMEKFVQLIFFIYSLLLSSFGRVKVKVLVTHSCSILCDPVDCSLPGSSVHGLFQARVLEWGATAFSKIPYINAYIWNLERQ